MQPLNFDPFPILKTERLVLRQFIPEDRNQIFALRSDPKHCEFLDRPLAKNLDDAIQFIDKINNSIINKELINWAINYKEELKLIGNIGFWNFADDCTKAELGYELLPEYQGLGIIQEAMVAVLEFGKKILQLNTITAEVAINNVKSIKILEKFNFIKHLTGNANIYIYELLLNE